MNEFEQWWASANTRLTDLPKAQAKFIWDAAQNKQAEPVAYIHKDDLKELLSDNAGAHIRVGLDTRHPWPLGSSESEPYEWLVALYTHPAPAVAHGAILRRVALGLLKCSKANFTKQFGVCANADWVYRDLEELFSCWGSETPTVASPAPYITTEI